MDPPAENFKFRLENRDNLVDKLDKIEKIIDSEPLLTSQADLTNAIV